VGLKANEITLNIESWEVFEKYSTVEGGGGYGRTVFRDMVRHSDRETTINKLLMKFKSTDRYLYEKNKGPEGLIESIEKQ